MNNNPEELNNAFDNLDDVLTLVDEEGHEHRFDVIDIVEVNDQEYALLSPLLPPDEGDPTVLILRFDGDDLVTLETQEEFDQVVSSLQTLRPDEDDS
jgi:putative Holliday junction resolvase